jgi:hypothetical protein
MSWRTVAVMAMLAVILSGCGLRGRRTVAAAPVPPPPPPAVAVHEGPLSVPQTAVKLPPPQPLDPRALETAAEEPPREPEAAPPPKPPRRPPTVATGPQPPAAETQPPPAATEERPRLQEILPPEEKRKLADGIAARRREINDVLQQAARRQLSEQDSATVERIRSFLQLSDQAAAREDMRQAEALSERALVLARELRVGR